MLNQLTHHIGRNLVAYIALFVALSGSAFAAAQVVAPNSVGTLQLKNSAVTSPKVANSTLTSVDVKNGTLLAADFKAGQLKAGPAGAQGPPGTAGAAAAKFWAVVSNAGSLVRGSGATDADKLAVGQYLVKFDASVASCAWVTTAGSINNTFSSIYTSANKDNTNDAHLRIGTFNSAGALADPAQVSVAVFC